VWERGRGSREKQSLYNWGDLGSKQESVSKLGLLSSELGKKKTQIDRDWHSMRGGTQNGKGNYRKNDGGRGKRLAQIVGRRNRGKLDIKKNFGTL